LLNVPSLYLHKPNKNKEGFEFVKNTLFLASNRRRTYTISIYWNKSTPKV